MKGRCTEAPHAEAAVVRRGVTCSGGEAWPGPAGRGLQRLCLAWQGMERRGQAWEFDLAWRGLARRVVAAPHSAAAVETAASKQVRQKAKAWRQAHTMGGRRNARR